MNHLWNPELQHQGVCPFPVWSTTIWFDVETHRDYMDSPYPMDTTTLSRKRERARRASPSYHLSLFLSSFLIVLPWDWCLEWFCFLGVEEHLWLIWMFEVCSEYGDDCIFKYFQFDPFFSRQRISLYQHIELIISKLFESRSSSSSPSSSSWRRTWSAQEHKALILNSCSQTATSLNTKTWSNGELDMWSNIIILAGRPLSENVKVRNKNVIGFYRKMGAMNSAAMIGSVYGIRIIFIGNTVIHKFFWIGYLNEAFLHILKEHFLLFIWVWTMNGLSSNQFQRGHPCSRDIKCRHRRIPLLSHLKALGHSCKCKKRVSTCKQSWLKRQSWR